uniref:Paired domain-containing protein n=1 Tax=Ditylenchus dipsaci TaxID=166011 RepID=A0A915DVP8_9BILA
MAELRAGIVRLHEQGYSVMDISRMMKCPNQTVSYAIRRYEETQSNADRPRSGRPATATTPENIRKIERKR